MRSNENRAASWPVADPNTPPFLQSPAEGRLVSSSMPSPGILVSTFLDHAEGQERFFWQSAGDEIIVAGFGSAVELMAWGEGRYEEIERKSAVLFSNADLYSNQNRFSAPRLFGGFAFRDDFAPDKTWAVFHPAHFVLPHFQLIQNGIDSWLTINTMLPLEEDLTSARIELKAALLARYEALLMASENRPKSTTAVDLAHVSYPMSYATWGALVEEAVSRIRASEMEKVVLARVCEVRSKKRINVSKALEYLNHNYKECTCFLFEPRPYHAFYGATPELLVKVQGRQLGTMALAGSIRRGASSIEDKLLTQQLTASDKEQDEHSLVVDSIHRRLQPFTTEITTIEKPEVYTLSYIHHLLTPINAKLKQEYGILPLVEILHPTPALGGTPRQRALNFIKRAEPVPRGWYAGPIGWIDHEMNGEFCVAIRSAVAQERRVWMYAGAGIVAESEADKEWAETSLKFKPMFAALGLKPGQMGVQVEDAA